MKLPISVISMLTATATFGAVVYTEDFGSGANGWGDRDSGEMGVSHQGSVGVPASAAMQGSFAAQGVNIPQTDAFRISSGANFIGNYNTKGNGLTQIQFDLFADDIVPSDLFIRLIDGSNTFSYQFNLGSFAINTWTTFSINLTWSAGWSGLSEGAFNTALGSVDALEIQLTRNNTGAQLYYLDNITTLDTDLGGGGGGSAVPEPGTGLLFLGAMVLFAVRRINGHRADAR